MIDTMLNSIKSLFGLDIQKTNTDNIECGSIEKIEEEEILSVEDIYTPLSVAKEEIWRRWNDKELRKKVEEFLGGDVPEFLDEKPLAVLARNLATPNNEFLRFLGLSELVALKPLCFEYLNDKFRSVNKDKYCLGKIFFCDDKNNKEDIKSLKVVNFDYAEGKKINEIETLWGEGFVNFHHRLLENKIEDADKKYTDMSKWIKDQGNNSEIFYEKYLALFICYGILFENFIAKEGSQESIFTKEVVMPSFKKINDIFNLKPIVVALNPIEDEDHMFFRCYEKEIEKCINYK